DPGAHRWPPHVTVLFGFVSEASFEDAAPLLAEAAAARDPFDTRLRGVGVFAHRGRSTVWLDPAASGDGPWQELRAALERRFPRCGGSGGGYVPHLTLGRVADPERFATEHAELLPDAVARVAELVLLSRRGDEPMRPRAVVELGTGRVRRLDGARGADAAPVAERDDGEWNARVTARLARALPGGVVHVVGSRSMGCALAGADLDLVAALPGEVDLDNVAARVAAALPEAEGLRRVAGARTPGLRLRVGGTAVDLVAVATGDVPPAEAVARRTELGADAAVALSAVGDAAAVRTAVGDRQAAFAALVRDVRTWARARGLDRAPFGGLPGLAWTVMAARTVLEHGADGGPDALLGRFFAEWAAWDWRAPVALRPDAAAPGAPAAPVRILTPSAPVRSCADQVSAGGRDLLEQELYRAWEIAEEAARTGADPRPALGAPPPMHRRHAAWAVVAVRAVPGERFDTTLGRVWGRMRALLTALERAGVSDAHAWPRPFATAPDEVRFAVGLGRTPPGAAALAETTGPWRARLRGADVRWADGGEVPTLR
ncbi:poly(A) polymerase, partial [Thermobifida halotolerans]|uniref:poly(A) polymerase n=1 Tax=Thermobifida halotolerans TaxID=483545 RepID=UPI0018FE8591